jgi:glycosyltransferase involved in cell wall biosynthesis
VSDRSIGVVIPAYQAADTLDATLASVAAQTLRPDAVVVVDDESSDGTAEVAERWHPLLPLTVIRQPINQGVSAARNTALQELSTDLVALLDADDIWFPDHLATLAELWEQRGGIVTAQALNWVPGESITPYRRRLRGNTVPTADQQFERLLHANFVFIGSLFERAAAVQVGGFTGSSTADWTMWLRLADRGLIVHVTGHPTALYRIHRSSMAADPVKLQSDILEALERLREELPARRAAIDAAIEARRCEVAVAAALDGRTDRAAMRRIAVTSNAGWRTRLKAAAVGTSPQMARRWLGDRGLW